MTRPAAPRPVGGETGNSLWSAVGWLAGTRAGAGATALRGLAAVLLAAVTWGWLVEPRWLQARAFRLPLAGGPPQPLPAAATRRPGPGGLRLAHLTDLHAPVYRIPEAALLRQLRAWQPDAVVFTGDLAEGPHHPATRGVALMARLARRWPVFLVPGNHDHLYGWFRLRRDLEAAGVQVLVNRGTVLRAGEAAVYLAGVDDPHTGRDRVGEALAGAPPGTPVVLLAHAPAEGIRRAAAARGVRLVLAGHTHGGQVRLPLVGALWIPGQGWFPRYDRGWFDIGGTWWYIATGLGTPRPWIRFRCRPELVLIELVPPAPRTGPPA
ncbi:metallophosphoesterase [Thermaerobacter marianensis DSM 12885]|uniref:Metallophosphoesterase n=1 Tax=Thermaerobacter marianensis (strain ATCC 700841 / DSM 12885 / JCM 10246 / 7p75a) TaxID=644966 RepID=E6SM78_THEM7|nr:metallophosphoesterase [Thermaerobacter marianensis]ADU51437.1 metallophosphoesterase [Thermaerobacter marianensis DSM 12885]